jgi:AGCS family alanine or glycine:cation symporter
MESLFAAVNAVLSFITPVSDFFWDFPKNFEWYRNIPLLGDFSLAIIVLVGSGLYFTFRLGFIQVRYFKQGIHLLTERRRTKTGISPLAAFFLSSAMRVGPGNIIGVTGAIAAGGPGALFWMWVSAFFGMATAYTESVLAQLFKERRGDEFVGGLPFYARKLTGNKVWVGVLISCVYILYAMFCLPAQGFNVVTSLGAMAGLVTGDTIPVQSTFYYVVSVLVVGLAAVIAFGGIKRVVRASDAMVPVMAIVYVLTVLALIVTNLDSIPYFFKAVFEGAFNPQAVFGGAFGTVLVQGVKRGLMSNEAGQGTITMAAAAAEARHPCEQGLVGALGVFLDTHVICTMTGFIIIMAHQWAMDPAAWKAAGTYPKFLLSIDALTPMGFNTVVMFLVSLCFCLFAYTTLVGMITFSEIAANRISSRSSFINFIRALGVFVAAFGIFCNIAGYDLSNLWAFSDLGNIIIVYCNIPMLYLGFKYVMRATHHYTDPLHGEFTSEAIGIDTPCWNHDQH